MAPAVAAAELWRLLGSSLAGVVRRAATKKLPSVVAQHPKAVSKAFGVRERMVSQDRGAEKQGIVASRPPVSNKKTTLAAQPNSASAKTTLPRRATGGGEGAHIHAAANYSAKAPRRSSSSGSATKAVAQGSDSCVRVQGIFGLGPALSRN